MDHRPIIRRIDLHNKNMEFKEETIQSRKNRVLDFLKELFCTNGDEIATNTLVKFTRESFFAPYYRHWNSVSRKNDRFLQKFDHWLQHEIQFPDVVLRCLPSSCTMQTSSTGGRPLKDFEDSSAVVKRRKTEELRKDKSAAELSFATAMKLRQAGDEAAAKLLTEATTTTPTRAQRILRGWRSPESQLTSYSLEEALALLISSNITRSVYNDLRSGAKKHGHDLYPPYYKVLQTKKNFIQHKFP